jgi:hypothetical protein
MPKFWKCHAKLRWLPKCRIGVLGHNPCRIERNCTVRGAGQGSKSSAAEMRARNSARLKGERRAGNVDSDLDCRTTRGSAWRALKEKTKKGSEHGVIFSFTCQPATREVKQQRCDDALLASVFMVDDVFFSSCLLLPPQFIYARRGSLVTESGRLLFSTFFLGFSAIF